MRIRARVLAVVVIAVGTIVGTAAPAWAVDVAVIDSTMRQFRCAEDPCLELVSAGEPITVDVQVTGAESGKVQLVEGDQVLGSDAINPADGGHAFPSIDGGLPAGTHNVSVEFVNDDPSASPSTTQWSRSFEIESLPAPGPGQYQRIAGATRFDTAAQMSADNFRRTDTNWTPLVYLARGDDPSDALCAGAAAARYHGALLLTDSKELSAATRQELQRAKPVSVYIVGGPNAVSTNVENQVRGMGLPVTRFAGNTRYETCASVADSRSNVFLATARTPADALAASAAAAQFDGAILLTDGDTLPQVTQDYLNDHADYVVAVGGPAARAYPQADDVVAGNDRYETAAKLADFAFEDTPFVGVATGLNWADALAGGPHIATRGNGPLLLVSDQVPPSVADFLASRKSSTIGAFVYGGTAAVSDNVANQIASMLGG